MMRRLLALTALGLGLLSSGLPALARAPRPELGRMAIEDPSGREIPDDHLQGTVRLRGRISSENGVEAWRIDVAPGKEASYEGFGTVCEGAVQGGSRSVEVDCEWDTAAYPDGSPSVNDDYRLRVWARSDGEEFRTGSDRVLALANPATEPRHVRLAYDKADGRVSLSWSANPEPDLIHYVVEERVGSKPWKTVGEPVATSWEQVMTEPGTYRYRVSAVRRVGDKDRTEPGPSAMPDSPKKVVVTRTAPGASTPTPDNDGPSADSTAPSPGPAPEQDGREATAAADGGARPGTTEPEREPVTRTPRRSPSPQLDLLGGTAAPDLRRPPSRRAVRAPSPRAQPAPVAAEPDPGYSMSLPYPTRPSVQQAPPAASPRPQPVTLSRSVREVRGKSKLPLSLAVLSASFLGLMAGLLHLGRSGLAARRRVPVAPDPADSAVPEVTPLEERLWWLGVQWRHADTATRLELMGDVLDVQLELVARLGQAATSNGSFGGGPVLSPVT